MVTRRTLFELKEAKARQEIVEGLVIAVDNIDRVIQIIRAANDPDEAKANLMAEPFIGLEEFLRRAGRSEAEIAAGEGRGAGRALAFPAKRAKASKSGAASARVSSRARSGRKLKWSPLSRSRSTPA